MFGTAVKPPVGTPHPILECLTLDPSSALNSSLPLKHTAGSGR